ncbi:MAG: methyltransferase, TrmH family [Actinomycetota bacterium]|nr:methyltransferase, TrmH family [Actinomycetota bacterium]MDQ1640847.1 methyltransferase, TrmH family [Actinomycetota bacterium]
MAAARRLTKRGFRAVDRRFLAEGPQAVREAVATPGAVLELFATPEAATRHADVLAAAAAGGMPAQLVSAQVMSAISQTVTPQGLVAVCAFIDRPLTEVVNPAARLVVVLADVRDPGNAGTVIRTADAAGADGVVLAAGSVDPYNGKCVRASAGSLFHLALTLDTPITGALAAARDAGLRVFAADGQGDVDLYDADERGRLDGPAAWVFGNEAWGLPAEVRALADEVIRVPLYGRAESLNLATAAAVCLYASARAQRRRAASEPR